MYLLPRPRSAPYICTRWDILDISIGHVLHPSLLSFSPPPYLIAPASHLTLHSRFCIGHRRVFTLPRS